MPRFNIFAPKPFPRSRVTYKIENFFHPHLTSLLDRLARTDLKTALDPDALEALERPFFDDVYEYHGKQAFDAAFPGSKGYASLATPLPTLKIDVDAGSPYGNYNWELLFHIPIGIAVHLSKTQRYEEARRWFHLVFDPSIKGDPWRSLALQRSEQQMHVDALLQLLSKTDLSADEQRQKDLLVRGYMQIMRDPFQPFAIARTRLISFQMMVVMKYLDNLLAWGDSLFAQNTGEAIDAARSIYVQGSNLLGPRPQQVPAPFGTPVRSYKQLRTAGMDITGNAWVRLESSLPMNYSGSPVAAATASAAPLFGLVDSPYFCIPRNDRLLRYWDDFADRLGKIREGKDLQGNFQRLALFDPPIDPAVLVRAAASGVDIGAAVAGLTAPVVPVRAGLLLQRALELASEARSLGNAVLSAIEKRDAEELTLLRQGHELRNLQTQREIRLLQWKQAEESTEALLRTHRSTLDRYAYNLRQLGQTTDLAIPRLSRDGISGELTEEKFAELHDAWVGVFDRSLPMIDLGKSRLASGLVPSVISGAQGRGNLFLTDAENLELNVLLPFSNTLKASSFVMNTLASVLGFIPDFEIKIAPFGAGTGMTVIRGDKIAASLNTAAGVVSGIASLVQDEAGMVSRTASYERRADDWKFQANQTARELMQQGRQIVASIIAEHAARREYENVTAQIEDSTEVDEFLQSKFSNLELQGWMQGELSRLHRAYLDFAVYTARKAEGAIKREVMRSELEATQFIGGRYWDSGRRGSLAGESLHLDLKRLEMAYLEANKHEDTLTKRISLRRLAPLQLINLQQTGTCEFTVPEWLFDLSSPGTYMRRIRRVSVSVPGVVGPQADVAARVSLKSSSLRKESGGSKYARQGAEDARFVDFGHSGEIVLPLNAGDAFESPSARDQLHPMEGYGAVDSTWTVTLPKERRQFDYSTIPDLVLTVQYTARSGGDTFAGMAEGALEEGLKTPSVMKLLVAVADEYPREWDQFRRGTGSLTFDLARDRFPYFCEGRSLVIEQIETLNLNAAARSKTSGTTTTATATLDLTGNLNHQDRSLRKTVISLPADAALARNTIGRPYLVFTYRLG